MLALSTSKVTHDFLRPFLKSLTRPQGKALLAFTKAMIQGETSILCQMGRVVQKHIMPKSFCEKMGKHLEKIKALHLKPLFLAPKTGWELNDTPRSKLRGICGYSVAVYKSLNCSRCICL
jgi:hypothetical protein